MSDHIFFKLIGLILIAVVFFFRGYIYARATGRSLEDRREESIDTPEGRRQRS